LAVVAGMKTPNDRNKSYFGRNAIPLCEAIVLSITKLTIL